MKALVIGATGATGRELVNLLIADSRFTEIVVFVRKPMAISHEKVVSHVIDFNKIEDYKTYVKGDVLFSCLGTTLKDAGSKEAQWKIDYDYQLQFAEIASQHLVEKYVLVSSAYANPNSAVFYSRMKGTLDEAVKKLAFKQIIIFQPPALIRENSKRTFENVGVKVLNVMNKLGLAKQMKPLHTRDLAKAMISSVCNFPLGIYTISPQEIIKINQSK